MTDIGFAPKEIIPQEVCRLEILAADKAETYGLRSLKLKVVGGSTTAHLHGLRNRDEDTARSSRAQSLEHLRGLPGPGFHKRPASPGEPGRKQFVARSRRPDRLQEQVEPGPSDPCRREEVKVPGRNGR
jgi:hypothetical protein